MVGLYTANPVIVAAALPLLAWVALFHVADAAQTVAAFVLRAYRIATVPLLIYVVALWGIGLGGGYLAAFDPAGISPAWMHGARGFWSMSTLGLVVAGAQPDRAPRLEASTRRVAAPTEPAPPARSDALGGAVRCSSVRPAARPAASITKQLPPPLARLAAHAAAVASGDLLDEGQAEADAAGLLGMAGQAKERLEDALAHRLGDARAAVADLAARRSRGRAR